MICKVPLRPVASAENISLCMISERRLASCEVRVEGVWGVLFSCRSLPDGEDGGDSLSLRSGLEGNDLVDYGDLDYGDYVCSTWRESSYAVDGWPVCLFIACLGIVR